MILLQENYYFEVIVRSFITAAIFATDIYHDVDKLAIKTIYYCNLDRKNTVIFDK